MNKEFGQLIVLENAGTWTDKAMLELCSYLVRMKEEFTLDDFRKYATEMGLTEPHHPNAWGALMNHAAKLNYIRFTGNVWESTRPQAHKRLIRGWIKV
jgi:hypothetical protein